jgi:hypothetical protein
MLHFVASYIGTNILENLLPQFSQKWRQAYSSVWLVRYQTTSPTSQTNGNPNIGNFYTIYNDDEEVKLM